MFGFISILAAAMPGWLGGEELSMEPSHPAARMGQGALEGWGVTEQRVPAPSVLCQCLLTLLGSAGGE